MKRYLAGIFTAQLNFHPAFEKMEEGKLEQEEPKKRSQ